GISLRRCGRGRWTGPQRISSTATSRRAPPGLLRRREVQSVGSAEEQVRPRERLRPQPEHSADRRIGVGPGVRLVEWTGFGWAVELDGGERVRFSRAEFLIKASADTTNGAFTIVEETAPLDTPPHVHEREDELFYVLEGEHLIEVAGEEFRVGPGGM